AMFVYRTLYNENFDCNVLQTEGNPMYDMVEYDRCLRQKRESFDGWSGKLPHTFYSQMINGTKDYNPSLGPPAYDLLREVGSVSTPTALNSVMAWQWQTKSGYGSSLDFGSDD